jgi:hypothetical protein
MLSALCAFFRPTGLTVKVDSTCLLIRQDPFESSCSLNQNLFILKPDLGKITQAGFFHNVPCLAKLVPTKYMQQFQGFILKRPFPHHHESYIFV